MPKKNRVDLPMQLRGAEDDARLVLVVNSVDEAARTVDVVWTTGAAVQRRGYMPDKEYGDWIEELEVSDTALDLTRLDDGAPVLKNHWNYELTDQVGAVVPGSVRIEGGKGLATLLISDREDVEPHWRDIKAGILRKISVGYNVKSYSVVREEGKLPVFRATSWMPMELSFVMIAADNQSQTRSEQERLSPCDIVSNQEKGADMPDKAKEIQGQDVAPNESAKRNAQTQTPPAPVADGGGASAPVDAAAITERAVQAERTRQTEIRKLCSQHSIDAKRADDLINTGVSVTDASAKILDILAERSAETQINGQRAETGFSNDDPAVKRERMAKAIASRHVTIADAPSEIDPDGKAWEKYRGWSMLGMVVDLNPATLNARHLMSSAGQAAVLRAAFHSTSDFPYLLGEAGNRVLMERYKAHEGSFRTIGYKRNLKDFRSTSLISFGDVPGLEPLKEDGEYKDFTLTEGKETIKLDTYGRQFRLTRQMLINDDLGAFVAFENVMAERSARSENKLFWKAAFEAKMSDNKLLFAAGHNNLAAIGAAPTSDGLDTGIKAMRTQQNSDKESIGVSPKFIVHGSALATPIQRLLMPVNPTEYKSDAVTPDMRKLEAVYEPMYDDLSANGWSLFADPNAMPVMAYGWLEGQEGPETFVHQNWSEDNVTYRVRDDFATAPSDYKGAYHNAGE
nr:prohead protease/major capsid protein fusion protein [uncultured Cohaesibacter sp.]